MKKNFRLMLASIILIVSVSLLVWGYSTNPRETRIQSVDSSVMQLP